MTNEVVAGLWTTPFTTGTPFITPLLYAGLGFHLSRQHLCHMVRGAQLYYTLYYYIFTTDVWCEEQ